MEFTTEHSGSQELTLKELCSQIKEYNRIDPADFERFRIKRGLRNADGTGVMTGISNVCSVDGYYIDDGEKIPREGRLNFRGISMSDIVAGCEREDRFGFEEIVWLLLFGTLPDANQLDSFTRLLAVNRELPDDFIEDMIMKAPSPDIMNKLARSVLALYSYDENPDDTSVENVLRQTIQIIAKMPAIMAYAYQVKRRHYYHKSMYIHQIKPDHTTAQAVLNSIRSDRKFTLEEAKLLDVCLMVHAEHGGGNNSTFANRVLTSSGTDTYSSIAAGIGALKGPKHGGANIKVTDMVSHIKNGVDDISNEGQVADFLAKIIKKEAGDGSGLIYGMGHAIYTLSDPRAKILKAHAKSFSAGTEFEAEFKLLDLIEKLTPQIFAKYKGEKKVMCANVDLYSGLVYKMLAIPEDLFTPIFTVARVAGWSAHRIEELLTGGRIIRPAYKNLNKPDKYVPLSDR
ncbi:MAG: citrate synthase [Clostridia bacterium]|nr:citrate synthase [Clostridia bacterium]